jgi:hypothetical protein
MIFQCVQWARALGELIVGHGVLALAFLSPFGRGADEVQVLQRNFSFAEGGPLGTRVRQPARPLWCPRPSLYRVSFELWVPRGSDFGIPCPQKLA